MSLNEDTVNEFVETTPGLTPVVELPTPAPDTTVIVDTNLTEEDDSEALSEFDASSLVLKTTIDQKDHYDRLVDVSKAILAAESISRSDIEHLFAAMDDPELASQFTSEVSTLYGFTSSKTRTNLDSTKQFISTALKQRKDSLDATRSEITTTAVNHITRLLDKVSQESAEMAEESSRLARIAQEAYAAARKSTNALFYRAVELKNEEGTRIEKSLFDIRTMSLVGYPAADASDAFDDLLNYSADYNHLGAKLIDIEKRAHLLSAYVESPTLSGSLYWFTDDAQGDKNPMLSYYDHLELLSSNSLTTTLENFSNRAAESRAALAKSEGITLSDLSRLGDQLKIAMSFIRSAHAYFKFSDSVIAQFRTVLEA